MAGATKKRPGKGRDSEGLQLNAGTVGVGIVALLLVAVIVSRFQGSSSTALAPPPPPPQMTTVASESREPAGSEISQPVRLPSPAGGSLISQGTPPMVPSDSRLLLRRGAPAETPENTSAPSETPPPAADQTMATASSVAPTSPSKADQLAARVEAEMGALSDLDLPDLVERVEKAVVRIDVKNDVGEAIGSGFVVRSDGVLVTNYHVIEGGEKATVKFQNGDSYLVEGVLVLQPEVDLAVVKINPGDKLLPVLPVAPVLPRKGEKVATFGAPKGLSFSTSEGIISGIRKADEVQHKEGTVLQTTAAISGGNSGGPLTNMRGEVVGINTFKWQVGESLNFAISCLDIQKAVDLSKTATMVALNAENVPNKSDSTLGSAVDLVGTERGRMLLSQIRECCVLNFPVAVDPTQRVMRYVNSRAERTLEQRLKWKIIRRRRDINVSTAIICNVIVFVPTMTEDANILSELSIKTMIFVGDVDKDGNRSLAKIWDEEEVIGRVSLQAMSVGTITRQLEEGINAYLARLVNSYRSASRTFGK
ncbi:trypsin-like peptidase domain-containing protein [Planctomicrobium sp. SH664]|uniref:S1C family serine protease n=1 Tax=Planctomicrobium sp. SH664 TaxID=3448125 RepID=UPI003F5B5C13